LIQRCPSCAWKFQIKYGFEDFGIRNNFPYWKFSNFGLEFELKTCEASGVWIWVEFDEILIQTPGFDDIWTKNSYLHTDDRSIMKRSLEFQICEFIELLQEFDLNFDTGYFRIGLINGFNSWLRP
jgi:hypothetical protein